MTSHAMTVVEKPVSTELAAFGEMSVQRVVDRKRKIQEVLEAVMKEGEHYGKIPGCGDKPSLFKAGAEVLATTFGFAPQFEVRRDDHPNGHREYQITCRLVHIATGAIVGEGLGSCSTMESKYRWRNADRKCPNCGKTAIIKGKAEYGGGWLCFQKKGGCGTKWNDGAADIEGQQTGRVENPDVADTYNTVLKIAKKRAQVDCTLTAVGASDVLTQDLEDLPPGSISAPPASDDDIPARGASAAKGAKQAGPNEHEAIALELIAEIEAATTAEAVRAFAPRCNALPKGSRARAAAREVYEKKIGSFPQADA